MFAFNFPSDASFNAAENSRKRHIFINLDVKSLLIVPLPDRHLNRRRTSQAGEDLFISRGKSIVK